MGVAAGCDDDSDDDDGFCGGESDGKLDSRSGFSRSMMTLFFLSCLAAFGVDLEGVADDAMVADDPIL